VRRPNNSCGIPLHVDLFEGVAFAPFIGLRRHEMRQEGLRGDASDNAFGNLDPSQRGDGFEQEAALG
jgi:hypothetical protein